jgi:hypothetical protein
MRLLPLVAKVKLLGKEVPPATTWRHLPERERQAHDRDDKGRTSKTYGMLRSNRIRICRSHDRYRQRHGRRHVREVEPNHEAAAGTPAYTAAFLAGVAGRGGMLTIVEAQRRTELFLTGQMLEALRAVEYQLPSFDIEPREVELADVARAYVEIRHVRGASDATYLVNAFDDDLLMQLQLNVHRLVVVYRVPALDALDASTLAIRLERWRIGAEHAGWKFGWRGSDRRRSRAAVRRDLLLCLRCERFSEKRAAAALLVHRHRANDLLLHDRGGPQRHPSVAAPRWVPGLAIRQPRLVAVVAALGLTELQIWVRPSMLLFCRT